MAVSDTTRTPTRDAVDLLLAQHEEAKALMSRVLNPGPERKEAFECLVRLLAVHETAEEEVVYPALLSTGAGAETVAEARKREEAQAKEVLAELEDIGVDGDGFAVKFATFRQEVLVHAEHEEREVFPRLRKSMDAEKLTSMREALEKAERMAPTHPHPHGPESAVGNLIVGPFVAVADRVRDALRGRSKD